MRSAEDFDKFYERPDPWRLSSAIFRSRAYERCLRRYISDKAVLELGCGEGHLTRSAFASARNIVAVDFSRVAIHRATLRPQPNAVFRIGDMTNVSFEGYDVVTAIECLYYLDALDQAAFLERVACEHRGIFILSVPIVGTFEGRHYFTHSEIEAMLHRHRMELVEFRNVVPRWDSLVKHAAAIAVKSIPGGVALMDYLPEALIYQRCYVAVV